MKFENTNFGLENKSYNVYFSEVKVPYLWIETLTLSTSQAGLQSGRSEGIEMRSIYTSKRTKKYFVNINIRKAQSVSFGTVPSSQLFVVFLV
ncbi:hypothetical protein DMB65_12820 [Flavobacterium cheongpyeongense]|uniref:Uncharacterized protein n=2 Tax=Flavobacterium cheongpyeongense TaxID=2212651 RepID=A0A2V4BS34_9FLAO|nr:hypothetical protein DMB65_12820 [Flavobacterium cheongpyeongense]